MKCKSGLRAGLLLLVLLAPLCAPAPASAQPTKGSRKDFVIVLDENNIKEFLSEVRQISTGQRPDMMDEDVENYFTNHIAEKGKFKSALRYEIPGFPMQETTLELGRDDYINSVVTGRYMLENYTTSVDVQDLKIGNNGKSATFKSITTERGNMPWIRDPEKKDEIEMIPIQGQSVCEQRLIVSFNNFIQMAQADCATVISFDAFAGKPLVPQ